MKILGTETFEGYFDPSPLELQAFKVMEEAGELQQAVKKMDDVDEVITSERRMWAARSELADVLQSALNMADALGLSVDELLDDMHDCYRRNYHRGRYE